MREIYSAYLDSDGDGIVHYDQPLDGLIEALQEVKSKIENA